MECKFVVGQKVVCINDDPIAFRHPKGSYNNSSGLDGLKKGEIYTIRSIYPHPTTLSEIAVELEEIVRPRKSGIRHTPGFDCGRFRPLKEKKTDISIFTEILNNVNNHNHDNNYDFSLDELFETVKK